MIDNQTLTQGELFSREILRALMDEYTRALAA